MIAALVVLVAVLAGCSSGATFAAPGPSVGQQLHRSLPNDVLGMRLLDSTGRVSTLAGLRGKVVVISDMLTLCQGTCPLDTANVVGAARKVAAGGLGSRVAFLSLTVDPQRDQAVRLTAYRRQYGPAPSNWSVLTGRPGDVNRFWNVLGVYRQRVADRRPGPRDWLTGRPLTYDVTHSDEVFFLDPAGRERFLLEGPPHVSPGSPVPGPLREFVAAGDEHPPSPAEGWTADDAVRVLSWMLHTKV